MSISENLENAIKGELNKPEIRTAIKGLEHALLEAAKNAVESVIPSPIRAIAGGLIDAGAEKGITQMEHWTDEALQSIGTIHITTPNGNMTLTYVTNPPTPSQK